MDMRYTVQTIRHTQSKEALIPNDDTEEENNATWQNSQNIADAIIQAFADKQKRAIMNAVADKPLTFIEIVKKYNIPLASCSRKINSLMEQGLITSDDTSSKQSKRYKLTFEGMKIELWKDKVSVVVIPNEKLSVMPSYA
jgi:predicted transcriptional regulator